MDEFVRVIQASSDSFSDPTRWVINENEQENVKYIEEVSWNLPIVGSILSCFMLQNRSQLIRSPLDTQRNRALKTKLIITQLFLLCRITFLPIPEGPNLIPTTQNKNPVSL